MDETDARDELSRRQLMRTAAAAGAVAVASGSVNAQEGEGGGGGGEEHLVEMNDQLKFVPADLTVAPGDTVVWETVGSQPHSVTAYESDIPEDAEYWASGGFGSESDARGAWPEGSVEEGETYSHTFEVEGTHDYFCIPHEGAGMVGSIEVTTDTGGEEVTGPAVTDSAKTIVVATVAAMVSTLALAYTFIKYGGGRGGE